MDGSDGKGGEKNTKATRDPTFFFLHDFIVLKVEDTLFRIPLFHLLKHGVLFRSAAGSSEENPFVVDGISVEEFRHFLRIILPSATENLETVWTNKNSASKDEWISVLKISTLWRCLSLRSIAIRALRSNSSSFGLSSSQTNLCTDLTPMERILLGRKYSISSWVEAGYSALVMNGSVSDSDMEAIGAVEAFKLMRIIQEAQESVFRSLQRSDISTTIKETFQAELSSIAATETAYSVRGVNVTPKSPHLPPAMKIPQDIDPSKPLHKQIPPPCNDYYLMECCKWECKYSHGYTLTPQQLVSLAFNAKKTPCEWLKFESLCPYGDECCWGHVCPNGPQCDYLTKGKCSFKESMHGRS